MPIKLKCFDTIDYFHVCGMHMKRFTAGVKGNVRIDYHFPHGVMVHRDGRQSEFIPIHCVRTVTPENPEDLQEALGEKRPVVDSNIDGPIPESRHPSAQGSKDFEKLPKENTEFAKKKRKRRTKAEMEAARVAAS